MKGIVLAGGLGTRLSPLTEQENKHFLPVYNKRMIEYPVATLVEAGIRDIVLVTGGKKPGDFLELFKNGRKYGLDRVFYTYQEGNGGLADALKLAEPFFYPGESCIVILGDNYFDISISIGMNEWLVKDREMGARVFLKQVEDPYPFGIATVEGDKIIKIVEKPKESDSNMAILGCYFFDGFVWKILQKLSPSDRNELEITDVLNKYLSIGELHWSEYGGFWGDMGTHDGLFEVTKKIKAKDSI